MYYNLCNKYITYMSPQCHVGTCAGPRAAPMWPCVLPKHFRAVVKHTKRKSKFFYKTELTKIKI